MVDNTGGDNSDQHDDAGLNHGARFHHSAQLNPPLRVILEAGLQKLLSMTKGLTWEPLRSERYPYPLTLAAYRHLPEPQQVREDVTRRMSSDPVSVLEHALALLELYECNSSDIDLTIEDDEKFIKTCFESKRCNGWISVVGDMNRKNLAEKINDRWRFHFFGSSKETGIYALLNMLARYGFVYGRIPFGDAHALSHFVEDHCPGLMIVWGELTDLELTLSLAALKMGLPAIVQRGYPFPLGNTLQIDTLSDIGKAVVGFRNIRKLLETPDIPRLPDYMRDEHKDERFEPYVTWGESQESFYVLRKGPVESSGVTVRGEPDDALGVIVTIEAEPMDSYDRGYLERFLAGSLSMLEGVTSRYRKGHLTLSFAQESSTDPGRIGEALLAFTRHEFPKLNKIKVEIIFEKGVLAEMAPVVQQEVAEREREIEATTEDDSQYFYQCVGCSPFAPDHVCVLTPERPPQCGRPYGKIKTGALYAYDDMSNIHHSWLHRDLNSYRVIDKGVCLDPVTGEWSGINKAATGHSHGRTNRIFLHSLDDHPHTGCGCFRLILFKTESPRTGIGVMDRAFEGRAADGRTWSDLHYSLAGKQTPGIAGAVPAYLSSPKFLKAHGGWENVVWVSPKIAEIMGDRLPGGVEVGSV